MPTSTTTDWPIGFAINERGPALDPAALAAFEGVPAAFVSDSLGRCTGSTGLLPFGVGPEDFMCGQAFTVRIRPGDNLMVHKAIMLIQPGDVLIIDGGGDVSQSVLGGNIRLQLMMKGVAGLVLDGALRDAAEFAEGGFPTYARAAQHRGPSKDGPGEINVPISCAGMVVHPGDLVIGDVDGVVIVPFGDAPAAVVALEATKLREKNLREAIENGTTDPERFNSILRAKGCPV
jgi:regulator of RNase E activity RraA